MVPGDEECWEVTEEQLAALDGALDVSDSGIEDGVLRKGDFRNLPNLMGLDLSGNELTELPQGGLRKLASLKELDLSDNEFVSLSDDFFEGVMTLRSLDMSGNPGSVTETEDDEQVSYVVVTADVEKVRCPNPFVCGCPKARRSPCRSRCLLLRTARNSGTEWLKPTV